MANAMQRFKKSGVKRLPALQGGNGVGGNKEGRKYLGPRPQNKVKQVQATGAVTNATEGVLKQRKKEYR
jgi:hypothetical protein